MLTSISIAFLLNSCVTNRVREHQAQELGAGSGFFKVTQSQFRGQKSNFGSYYSVEVDNVKGSIWVKSVEEGRQLQITISFTGKKDSVVRVNDDKLKYKYTYGMWTEVTGKLTAFEVQTTSSAVGIPEAKETHHAFQKDYKFATKDQGPPDSFYFVADIPNRAQDLEIEIPEIFVDKTLLTPKTLKFKWGVSCGIAPVNG